MERNLPNPKNRTTDEIPILTSSKFSLERETHSLSLRKQKITEGLLEKRMKPKQKEIRNSIEINHDSIYSSLPPTFTQEFDIYESKLELISQFLTSNFSALGEIKYNPKIIIIFALLKLRSGTEDESNDHEYIELKVNDNFTTYLSISQELLDKILAAGITLLKSLNSEESQLGYLIINILINMSLSSEYVHNKGLSTSIWKRGYEISKYNIIELTSEIIWGFYHIITDQEIALQVFSTVNLCDIGVRYFKQGSLDYRTLNEDDAKQNGNFILVLLKYDPLYFIPVMSLLYNHLIILFMNLVSFTLLKEINPSPKTIAYYLHTLILIFKRINKYIDTSNPENRAIKELFFGESFINSLSTLQKSAFEIYSIRIHSGDSDLFINVINEGYVFIGLLFTIGSQSEVKMIYKNRFITHTEIILNNLDIIPDKDMYSLLSSVMFGLSNLIADCTEYASDVINNSSIPDTLVELFNKERNMSKDTIFEFGYFFRNAFCIGNEGVKRNVLKSIKHLLIGWVEIEFNESGVLKGSIKLLIEIMKYLRKNNELKLLKDITDAITMNGGQEKLEAMVGKINNEDVIHYIEELLETIINGDY